MLSHQCLNFTELSGLQLSFYHTIDSQDSLNEDDSDDSGITRSQQRPERSNVSKAGGCDTIKSKLLFLKPGRKTVSKARDNQHPTEHQRKNGESVSQTGEDLGTCN